MLPDYPHTKKLVFDACMDRVRIAQQRKLGIFSTVKQVYLHEGLSCILFRADGTICDNEMTEIESTTHIKHDLRDFGSLPVSEIMTALDRMGEELADAKAKLFIERFDEACESVGNVSDPTKSFEENFFDLIEKQEIDFEPNGEPCKRQILVGSDEMAGKFSDLFNKLRTDSQLKRKYDSLMDRKRQEWRDREADRNLVE